MDVDVDELPRDPSVVKAGRLARDAEVEAGRQEMVEYVPVGGPAAVQLDDAPVLDDEGRRRVIRTVECDETQRRQRLDQHFTAKLTLGAGGEP
jgi:hypothetical protein